MRPHLDYTAIGHVTIDVLEDGTRKPGGSAFYAALQAARLGHRAAIITRGVASEIERMLAPYRREIALEIFPAEETTTLETIGRGSRRAQRVLAWAGEFAEEPEVDTALLHLAPVVREGPAGWHGRADFVGLTPQGLVREWLGDGEVRLAAGALAAPRGERGRLDALVLSEQERSSCEELIAEVAGRGGVVAVTDGSRPTAVWRGEGERLELAVPPLERSIDDLGAGDVFAAAFFLALADGRGELEAASRAHAAAAVRMGGTGAGAIGDRAAIARRLEATEVSGRRSAGVRREQP